MDEELLLVRFYCDQASKIVQTGFNLPESVVTTAVSYVKRFYLKNSVMEYHPKIIMYVEAPSVPIADPQADLRLFSGKDDQLPDIDGRFPRTFRQAGSGRYPLDGISGRSIINV